MLRLALALLVVAPLGVDAQTARVALRWKEVPGAVAYEIQIAVDPQFSNVVQQTQTTMPGYRWEHLPSAVHWWRVRSFDSDRRPSEWSLPKTISINAAVPPQLRPIEGAQLHCGLSHVAFELESSPLIHEYIIEVSRSPDFQSTIIARGVQPVLKVEALESGKWHWRVRATDFKGQAAGPGPMRTFTIVVPAPKPKSPPDSVLGGGHIQLAWTETACAKRWIVEATNEGRDRISLNADRPSLAFKAGVAGAYRWRVAGIDDQGNVGAWSPEVRFKVRLAAPTSDKERVADAAQQGGTPVATGTENQRKVITQNDTDGSLKRANMAAAEANRRPLAALSVASYAGFLFNGLAITSPTATLQATYRLPWFSRRPAAALRASVYRAHSALVLDDVVIDAVAIAIPLSVAFAWREPFGAWNLKGLIGAGVQIVSSDIARKTEMYAIASVEAALGISRTLGPGRVELEIGGLYARLDSATTKLIAGGVAIRLGYEVDVLGGM